MDNQRTPSHGPYRGPQSLDRAEQQRGYRGRERDAFRTLVAALKEVELTNPRSRRDILRRGEYFSEVLLLRAKLTRKKRLSVCGA